MDDVRATCRLASKKEAGRRVVNLYVRSLFSLATLAFITLYGRSVRPTLAAWSALAAMVLLYQVMI